ncbi:MAG: sugar ABC transporter ATP-binding protein [Actinobacteria bacterium]|nr:sugar ABC transporter ATP-binding protein [Actinomycetota bacterium]
MTKHSGPLVELTDISKSFGAVRALQGATLTVDRGEVVGLVGDNGAGKSTLMKVLSGVVVPDSGSIRIKGEECRFRSPADAHRKGVATVYQDLALCGSLDVASNLLLGLEPRRLGVFLSRAELHRTAQRVLSDLRVKIPSTRQVIEDMSGGQRQSVAIARAVIHEPDILIMDEPTAALAVAEVEAVLRLIRRVASEGVAVILITHRLQDLFTVCDRIDVMYEGRSVASAAADSLTIESLVGIITQGEMQRMQGTHD